LLRVVVQRHGLVALVVAAVAQVVIVILLEPPVEWERLVAVALARQY